jgi:hypothetical protein
MVRKAKLENVGAPDEGRDDETESVVPTLDETFPDTEVTQESSDEAEEDRANVSANQQEKLARLERNALLKEVGKIGATMGASAIGMINLAETVTEGAMHRAFAPDHAEEIYDRFQENRNAKATLDDVGLVPDLSATGDVRKDEEKSDNSRTVQLSKLRAFIKLGNRFEDDAADVVRRARNLHIEAMRGDRSCMKKGSTYTQMYSTAVAQCKKDRAGRIMTDDEIRAIWTTEAPAEKEPKDGIGKLIDALNSVIAAGKGGRERAALGVETVAPAYDALRRLIGELDPERLAAAEAKHAASEERAAVAEFRSTLKSMSASGLT